MYGCTVVDLDIDAAVPELREAAGIWAAMLGSAQTTPFADIITQERPGGNPGFAVMMVELLASILLGGSTYRHTLPALGLALLEKITDMFPGETARLESVGAQART